MAELGGVGEIQQLKGRERDGRTRGGEMSKAFVGVERERAMGGN